MLRLAVVLALVATTAGARPRATPCDVGRFLTPDARHVVAYPAARAVLAHP